MAGQLGARTIQALRYHIIGGMTAYAAAMRAQIAVTTMYRNPLYKAYRDHGGDPKKLAAIKEQLDIERPLPRKPKKPARFARGV
jgi:hypothetical protein